MQENVKSSIESMTGLRVVEVNVFVQSVVFEKPVEPEPEKPTATDDAAADEAKTTSKRRK